MRSCRINHSTANVPLFIKSFTPGGIASIPALIASNAWSYGTGVGVQVSIMIPSYTVKVEKLAQTASLSDHSKPTAIWPTTLPPILTVFDMILIEVV